MQDLDNSINSVHMINYNHSGPHVNHTEHLFAFALMRINWGQNVVGWEIYVAH